MNYNLTDLTTQEMGLISKSLGQLPYDEVFMLADKINSQLHQQQEEHEKQQQKQGKK